MAGSHQFLQHRTWLEFRIGELVMEDLHEGAADRPQWLGSPLHGFAIVFNWLVTA
jgi:hypothetical protein